VISKGHLSATHDAHGISREEIGLLMGGSHAHPAGEAHGN
jgi:hypothetical protein